jgi:hypothetical protein
MLLECNNCGAPLDIRGTPDVVSCGYCGAAESLAHLRTLETQTPKGWQRPHEWRPPDHVPADSAQVYRYRGARTNLPVLVSFGVVALASIAAAAGLVSLRSNAMPSDGTCPAQLSGLAQPSLSCRCAGRPTSGSVWGSGTYTADSSVCLAAVHAGAVSASGGQVQVHTAPGCPGYQGSLQHGVETHSWGQYGQSFYFVGHGDGRCAPSQAGKPIGGVAGRCPSTFQSAGTAELHCTCTANQFSGSVWGSDIYTGDSSLCNAALHAGAVPNGGGAVVAIAAPGCASYAASSRNGVTTSAWKQYQNSFYFQGHGSAKCQ